MSVALLPNAINHKFYLVRSCIQTDLLQIVHVFHKCYHLNFRLSIIGTKRKRPSRLNFKFDSNFGYDSVYTHLFYCRILTIKLPYYRNGNVFLDLYDLYLGKNFYSIALGRTTPKLFAQIMCVFCLNDCEIFYSL